MRRFASILLLAAAAALPAGAENTTIVRTETRNLPSNGVSSLSLDVAVGEIEVSADDSSDVRVEIRFACSTHRLASCMETAKRARVDTGRSGDRLDVNVRKFPKWKNAGLHVKAHVIAPRRLGVKVDLGVGEVHVEGFEGNVDVDLGVGEAHVQAPESAVRSVSVDTGIGESHLIAAGRHFSSEGLFTRTIDWDEGTGRSRVSVDCGVGEAHVRLDRGEAAAAKR